MLDIFEDITSWSEQGRRFAIATVTQTWGSSPRGVGSAMAISENMDVTGSVSGGCIEGAVIEAAQKVLQGNPPDLLGFGVSHETAWSVGLTCGGKVAVYVEPHISLSSDKTEQQIWQAMNRAVANNSAGVLATRLAAENYQHLFINVDGTFVGDWEALNEPVVRLALEQYKIRKSAQVAVEDESIFLQVIPRQDRLFVIGAAHISIPLVRYAKDLNFEVIVIDPRQIFGTADRFPVPPDVLSNEWPEDILPSFDIDDDCYAVLLSHDPKIDDPALHILLRTNPCYIGALGSRRTHAKRCSRLEKAGFSAEEIERIHGPAGLDIHAKTPDEIALSIVAEVVQTKRGRQVGSG